MPKKTGKAKKKAMVRKGKELGIWYLFGGIVTIAIVIYCFWYTVDIMHGIPETPTGTSHYLTP